MTEEGRHNWEASAKLSQDLGLSLFDLRILGWMICSFVVCTAISWRYSRNCETFWPSNKPRITRPLTQDITVLLL